MVDERRLGDFEILRFLDFWLWVRSYGLWDGMGRADGGLVSVE
jgi:hypothetical protein